MAQLNGHWTNASLESFLYRIAFDFVTQLEEIMETEKVGRGELATKLGVTKGRVSQILNHPGNLTLKNVVQYTRALDRKVALVAYEDDDTDNDDGPINPQVFVTCWKKAGKPTDLFSANVVTSTSKETSIGSRWGIRIQPPAPNGPVKEGTTGTDFYMIQKEQWDARTYAVDL